MRSRTGPSENTNKERAWGDEASILHLLQPLGHYSHWQQIQPGPESELVLDVSASRDPVARGRVNGDAVEGPTLISAGEHLLETSGFLGLLQHGCHWAPVWSSGADTVELHKSSTYPSSTPR